jgi:hypothetical protein
MTSSPDISPHRGREIDLIITGQKPLAYFADELLVETFVHRGYTRSLIFKHGEERRAEMFRRAYHMNERGLISDRVAHARCGLLLGYSKDQVRSFLLRDEMLR